MPFLTGFGKRKEIRYGTTFPGSNLTDFPKLFEITADANIAAELSGGGGIAVTAADGTTEVPFGLYPSSAPASGTLILRAKFSPLTAASTGDVMGYLYYDAGASTAAHENKAGTVSNGYKLFLPLEEDPSGSSPQMLDWVSGTKVGATSGGMTSGDLVAAQVGNGLDLDGSDDAVTVTNGGSLDVTVFTLSIWLKVNSILFSNVASFISGPGGISLYANSHTYQALYFDGSFARRVISTADVISNYGTWIRIDVTCSGGGPSDLAIYANGSLNQTSTGLNGVPTGSGNWVLGAGGDAWSGVADEWSVSSVARTADWIAYAYADDHANSGTFSLGTQETSGGGTFTATAALAGPNADFAATGHTAVPTFTASLALIGPNADSVTTTTFVQPVYHGSGSFTGPNADFVAVGHSAVTFRATASGKGPTPRFVSLATFSEFVAGLPVLATADLVPLIEATASLTPLLSDTVGLT